MTYAFRLRSYAGPKDLGFDVVGLICFLPGFLFRPPGSVDPVSSQSSGFIEFVAIWKQHRPSLMWIFLNCTSCLTGLRK